KEPGTIHRCGLASPASALVPGLGPGDFYSQSSVNASQAMLSQAMLSQAMLSQAMLSQAMLSQAVLSQATPSQAKLSQAALFQSRVSQVISGQKMPPASGSCYCSGEPKRTGYSARAKPSAGRSPRLAQGTGAGLKSVPTRNPPGRSPGPGAASQGTAMVAAYTLSSPLPSAIG